MDDDYARRLKAVDWEFADYRGFSSSLPADVNALHWYPAPFVPQIPAILLQELTDEGDIILDPFAGSGVALLEAVRLRRRFVGIDVNPYALDIVRAKMYALSIAGRPWLDVVREEVESLRKSEIDINVYRQKARIDEEAESWFETRTLGQLCALHRWVATDGDDRNRRLKETILSSILNRCSSQKEHYTYITDSCYPKDLVHIDAISLFLQQTELTSLAATSFREHYERTHHQQWAAPDGWIVRADSRELGFLKDKCVHAVITSPPYLGVNDYVRSMRLTSLFYPSAAAEGALQREIGARRKRNRKHAYDEYICDMQRCFSGICRVLKPDGFLCLVIGEGRGRVSRGTALQDLLRLLENEFGFVVELSFPRTIKFRRIQIKGVEKEEILVLRRGKLGKEGKGVL